MLKKIVNEARFVLRIETTGPLLVRSGHTSISGPDMTPVRTYRGKEPQVYLPGSSLKGVFRSHLEKIAGSLKTQIVCDPFSGREETEKHAVDQEQRKRDFRESCSVVFERKKKEAAEAREKLEAASELEERTDLVYAESCPICRLFGSTAFIGRVSIGDAYLAPNSRQVTEQRDGVGIDRLTGGSSHGAKFDLEVVSNGVAFETEVFLRNFEIWQLGMLFLILQDLEDELIRIGSGRARGLGRVKGQLVNRHHRDDEGEVVTSTIYASEEAETQLWGLGRWLDGAYGTWQNDFLELDHPVQRAEHGVRLLRTFKGEALTALRKGAIKQCIQRLQNWPPPTVAELSAQAAAQKA